MRERGAARALVGVALLLVLGNATARPESSRAEGGGAATLELDLGGLLSESRGQQRKRQRMPLSVLRECSERAAAVSESMGEGERAQIEERLHDSMDRTWEEALAAQSGGNPASNIPFVVAAPYVGSTSTARQLRREFGDKGVQTLSSNRRGGWSCFIVHAPGARASSGESLLHFPGVYGALYAEPLPQALKISSSVVEDRGARWSGIVAHFGGGHEGELDDFMSHVHDHSL